MVNVLVIVKPVLNNKNFINYLKFILDLRKRRVPKINSNNDRNITSPL